MISIHAPAKGATLIVNEARSILEFQSTLPRRERRGSRLMSTSTVMISIHAPAKGATRPVQVDSVLLQFQSTLPRRERHHLIASRPYRLFNFNPRSREGSDVYISVKQTDCTIFQSTLPRRERQHLLTSFRLQYGYSLFHLTNKI